MQIINSNERCQRNIPYKGKFEFDNTALEYFNNEYNEILNVVIKQNPIKPKPPGKRGRPKKRQNKSLSRSFS